MNARLQKRYRSGTVAGDQRHVRQLPVTNAAALSIAGHASKLRVAMATCYFSG
jgi:hypothetical protein